MLPTLTELVSGKRFTNNSVRPTSIRQLKRAGMEDREVTSLSGHKDPNSLQHYDPGPGMAKMAKMAEAIANGKRAPHEISAPKPSTSHAAPSSSSEPTATTSTAASTAASPDTSSLNILQSKEETNHYVEEMVVPLEDIQLLNFDPSQIVVIAQNEEIIPVEKNSLDNVTKTFSGKENEDPLLALLRREQDLTAQECNRIEKETSQRRQLDERRMALVERYLTNLKK